MNGFDVHKPLTVKELPLRNENYNKFGNRDLRSPIIFYLVPWF